MVGTETPEELILRRVAVRHSPVVQVSERTKMPVSTYPGRMHNYLRF
jgi:hypothetical protein